MPISKRAKTTKTAIRKFLKGADRTLPGRRKALDALDRAPRPRKVSYAETALGGIPAIVATPKEVVPERHILYFHGGGYVVGSPKSHIAFGARLAKRAAASVTVIDYRLAPEHVYPAAIDDCVAAYRSLTSDVDPALITIAGDSAGGGAALSTMRTLRDAGDELPACAYLLSPWTDLTGSGESVNSKAEADPMIVAGHLVEAGGLYAGDTPLDDPGVSPLFADLGGLPPMLVQTGSDEVLLSDSTRLIERAQAVNVDAQLDLFDGMWHVFQMFPGLPEAKEALVRGATFIRSHTPAQASAGVTSTD